MGARGDQARTGVSTASQRILLVFVDGVGIGAPDPTINPLAANRYPAVEALTGGARLTSEAPEFAGDHSLYRTIDANLGVDGLPQSGTGQATLFTGVNCAELAGRHYGPFPHSSSKSVIGTRNLFIDAARVIDTSPIFANAYPNRFFRYIERTQRWTVTTLCCASAGVRLRTGEDLRKRMAVSADITGRAWPEPDSKHEVITPHQAGRRLTGLAEESGLTVFEYFETDKAGHSRDFARAADVLSRLDGLLEGILDSLRPDQSLVVTSDHGNLEDLSRRTHTRNPVPLMVHGPAAHHFRDVDGLASVKPAILTALGGMESPFDRHSGEGRNQ